MELKSNYKSQSTRHLYEFAEELANFETPRANATNISAGSSNTQNNSAPSGRGIANNKKSNSQEMNAGQNGHYFR